MRCSTRARWRRRLEILSPAPSGGDADSWRARHAARRRWCQIARGRAVRADADANARSPVAACGLNFRCRDGSRRRDWVRGRRRSSAPSRSRQRFWIVPSWSRGRRIPARAVLRLDPASRSAPARTRPRAVPAWLRRTSARGDARARLRLRLGHPRSRPRSSAPRVVASTSIRRLARARTTRAPTASTSRLPRPTALPEGRTFDVVVANILTNPLIVPRARDRDARARPAPCAHGILEGAGGRRRRRVCTVVYTRAGRERRLGAADRAPRPLASRPGHAPPPPDDGRRTFPLPRLQDDLPRDRASSFELRDGQVRCGHCRTVFNGARS